jgi:hypothetical protein
MVGRLRAGRLGLLVSLVLAALADDDEDLA